MLFQLIDCVLLCKGVCKETVSIRSSRTQSLSQLEVFLDDAFALLIRIEKSVAETLSVKPPGTTQRGKSGDEKQVFDPESTQFIHDHNCMAKTEATRPQDKIHSPTTVGLALIPKGDPQKRQATNRQATRHLHGSTGGATLSPSRAFRVRRMPR